VHSRVLFHESLRSGYGERARGDEPSDCISWAQCRGGRKRLEKVRLDKPSLEMRCGGESKTDEARIDEPPSLGTNGDLRMEPACERSYRRTLSGGV
jgi:hypothetical protein